MTLLPKAWASPVQALQIRALRQPRFVPYADRCGSAGRPTRSATHVPWHRVYGSAQYLACRQLASAPPSVSHRTGRVDRVAIAPVQCCESCHRSVVSIHAVSLHIHRKSRPYTTRADSHSLGVMAQFVGQMKERSMSATLAGTSRIHRARAKTVR